MGRPTGLASALQAGGALPSAAVPRPVSVVVTTFTNPLRGFKSLVVSVGNAVILLIDFSGRGKMGRPTGFEPATPGITILCSNQLSYGRRKGR